MSAESWLILLACSVWGIAGFTVCRVTHRTRGIDVDSFEQWRPTRPYNDSPYADVSP